MKVAALLFLLFLAEVSSLKGRPPDEKERLREHEREIKKLRQERNPRRRHLMAVKKLKHVQTDKCLDFDNAASSAYGLLVACDDTNTKVEERASPNDDALKTFDIAEGLQAGKCLDSWAEGAYPCDRTSWQDWQKSDVGHGHFTLQDQYYEEYLDDWSDSGLDMDDYNPGCTCQHWMLV